MLLVEAARTDDVETWVPAPLGAPCAATLCKLRGLLHTRARDVLPALGAPHLGHTAQATWQHTLCCQQLDLREADFLLLVPRAPAPGAPPAAPLVAVRIEPPRATPAWYAVDPRAPGSAFLLDGPSCSQDLDVVALVRHSAPGRALSSRKVRDALRRDPPALSRAGLWPGMPAQAWDGFTRRPATLLLFAPLEVRHDRALLLSICRHAGLPILAWARFSRRGGRQRCPSEHRDTGHLVLRIVDPAHLQQLRSPNAFTALARSTLRHTGMRLVWPELASECPTRAVHVPARSGDSCGAQFVSYNPFAALAPADDVPAPTHAPPTPAAADDVAEPARPAHLGSLNVNGLASDRGTTKLLAVVDLMVAHDIGILAIQETHCVRERALPLSDRTCAYHGAGATPTSTGGRPSGGHGFLVRAQWADRCTYLGQRTESRYAPAWLKVRGGTPADDIHIACVYLPDRSRRRNEPCALRDALSALEADVTHYAPRPGAIVVLGDFNVRVGNRRQPEARVHPAWQHAPAVGEDCSVRDGLAAIALLEALQRCNLDFLPVAPACTTGPAHAPSCRPTFVRGVCRSCIDYIVASVPNPQHSPVTTLLHTAQHVVDCGTDHVPVLAPCLPTLRPAVRRRAPASIRWRLERLHDDDVLQHYQDELDRRLESDAARTHDAPPAPVPSPQRLADTLAAALRGAATAALGTRTVVPGITKSWMTASVSAAIAARRRALRADVAAQERLRVARCAYLNTWDRAPARRFSTAIDDCTQSAAALKQARSVARSEVRAAQAAHATREAAAVNRACACAPTQRATHALLRRAARQQRPVTGALELRLPGSCPAQTSTDVDDVLHSFSHHFASLGAAPCSGPPTVVARRQAVRAQVAHLDAATLDQPCPLDAPITVDEVRRALKRTAPHKAPGHDGIPAALLKQMGPRGQHAAAELFNAVLDTGALPTQWRHGVIAPVHKRGDTTDCGNYRGITLLPAIDKLFMAVLATRVLSHVRLHDQQYGFVRGKGTTEALFNLLTHIDAHRESATPLYAFFLDIKKAFDTVNLDMLMLKLHGKGVTGKVWRVLRRAYQQISACVKLDDRHGDRFPITQGVAQGCPLSPVLFIIFMDDLLGDIHTACGDTGLELSGFTPAFCGQSFADDTVVVSRSPGSAASPGLQQVITVLHAHSVAWDWSANVVKSKVMLLNVADGDGAAHARDGPHPFTWGDAALPVTVSEKYLGVSISADGTWAAHLQAKLRSGRSALARWRPLLHNRRITCAAKIQVLRTHVLPTILFGLEVVTPAGTADRAALQALCGFVHTCVDAAFGLMPGAHRLRRCIKRDVLYLDGALVTVAEALDVAHIRFAAKPLPPKPQEPASSGSGQHGLHERAPGLTAGLRATLPASHPWRRCVDEAVSSLLPDSTVAPPAPGLAEVPAAHTLLRASNRDITAAVHARRARALRCGCPLASAAAARAAPARAPVPARRSQRIAAQAEAAGLQPLARVYGPPALGRAACHCNATADVAQPFLALRSGHLLSELDWPESCVEDMQHAVCPCCQAALCDSGFVTAASRPWLRIWHLLTGCASDAAHAPHPVPFVLGQQAYARQLRGGPASRAAARACDEHCAMLAAVLACVRRGGPLRVQDFGHAESFLAFLMDPVSALQPAFPDRGPLLRRVSVFLRGGAEVASAGRPGRRLRQADAQLGSDGPRSAVGSPPGASAPPAPPPPPPLGQPACALPAPPPGEPLSAPPGPLTDIDPVTSDSSDDEIVFSGPVPAGHLPTNVCALFSARGGRNMPPLVPPPALEADAPSG